MSEVAYTQTDLADDPWRMAANCLDHHPEKFTIRKSGEFTKIAAAKKICSACVVKTECLADALVSPNEGFSIRGGMTPVELRRERNKIRTAPLPVVHLALVEPLPEQAA